MKPDALFHIFTCQPDKQAIKEQHLSSEKDCLKEKLKNT